MRTSPENRRMVRRQIYGRGIRSRRVLRAFLTVDRAFFVPGRFTARAYGDHPVPIPAGQTISQPYMVAIMLEHLRVRRGMRVLEVGSGSGYALALLKAMSARPFGVEWHNELESIMRGNLQAAGFPGIPCRFGDGGLGWPEEAPFDRIVVSAACPSVPEPLLNQLVEGGLLLAPVNEGVGQVLLRCRRGARGRVETESLDRCVFVPLLGRYGR
jgi:protein-L-isoaspartate(D-aspartate) O-methyltransferase